MAIYKDSSPTKDGRTWYFSTYYVDLDGKNKKKKSKKYELKKEAEEAERIFLMTYKDNGNYNDITFKDLINEFKQFKKDKVKITTYKNYDKYNIRVESLFNIKVQKFNINQYNIWKDNINDLELSTKYKNNIYKFLRSLLNYAVKYHNMYELNTILNKMTGFNNPNELKKEMNFWTHAEFKLFIDQVEDLKYKCFFEMLYYCGLRKGEANALNWNDINFEKGTVNVNKNVTLKIKGFSHVILPTKTKSSTEYYLYQKCC